MAAVAYSPQASPAHIYYLMADHLKDMATALLWVHLHYTR
jgi:hypothetical protein